MNKYGNLVIFTIDDRLRRIIMPDSGDIFGVVGDVRVNRIMFKIPRYCADFDISEFTARINYVNPNGDANYFENTNLMTANNDVVSFVWEMEPDVTSYVGDVKFSVKLYKKEGQKVVKEFNTLAATGHVLEGFSVESTVTPEQQQTLLEKLEAEIKEDIDGYIQTVKETLTEEVKADVTKLKEDLVNIDSAIYKRSNNLFDSKTVQSGKQIDINQSGKPVIHDSTTWNLTDYIELEATTRYYFKVYDFSDYTTGYRVIGYCYDANKQYLGKADGENTETAPAFDSKKCKRLSTLENTKYIIVQFQKALDTYNEIMLMKSYSEQYEAYYVLNVATKNDVDECLQEAKAYTDNHGSGGGGIQTVNSEYSWFYNNATKESATILMRNVNTSRAYKMLTEKETNLLQSGDVFQHDATLCYFNDDTMLYCFYVNNKVDKSDSAYGINAYVRLTRLQATVNGSSSITENIDVCKNGDTVDGLTVLSGCGVPNAILKDSTLYMYWSCRLSDDKWYECYCTYDCVNHTIGTPHICRMDNNTFSCERISAKIGRTDNGQISMNASIAELNGVYYACLCCTSDWKNGIIVSSNDLVNWNFVAEPSWLNDIESNAIYEGAMAGFNGYLYLALRQINNSAGDATPMIFAKMNTDGTIIQNILLPSISSRPSFFKRGTTALYLAFPTNNRLNTVCLNVSEKLEDSTPHQDIATGGNYVQIAPRTENLQFVVRTQGTTGLRISAMNGMQKSKETVMIDVCTALGY